MVFQFRGLRRRRVGGGERLEDRQFLASDFDAAAMNYTGFERSWDPVPSEWEVDLPSITPAGPWPLAATAAQLTLPELHSFPEATAKVYLDFDGNTEASWGSNTNIVSPAFDLDGNATSFNAEETRRIEEIWKRVSEDYSPFKVDVTTADPSDAVTTLRENTSTGSRIRTFYFRKHFEIADPSTLQNVFVELLRDDGGAVYLNGTQIARSNLPANAEFDDFASNTTNGNDESRFFRFGVSSSFFVAGDNVLAVEVHQSSDDSSDVSFDLRLVDATTNQTIVASGSEWRYLDDGSNQGVAWRAAAFNDATWPTGVAQFGYGDAPGTTHVVIGGSSEDWFGSGAGGVAFVGSFSITGRTVAYVFPLSLGNDIQNIAEASSHEAGHTFGLQHQSSYDASGNRTAEYNSGSGDWGPIMGVGYGRALSTWHNGTTTSATTRQDDLSVISRGTNGFGYRVDDHGNSLSNATSLPIAGNLFDVSGILERNNDIDAFRFALDANQAGISLHVDGIGAGTNLNAVLEILDSADQVVAESNPTNSYNAALELALAPGTYVARVKNTGEYGRVGQYRLSGRIDEPLTIVDQFTRLEPVSTLAYRAVESARINFTGDQDTFRVPLRAGQRVFATVTPTSPLALLSITSATTGQTVQAARAGDAIVWPVTEVSRDASWDWVVSSAQPTDYELTWGLNYQPEFFGSGDGAEIALTAGAFLPGERIVVGSSGDGADLRRALVSQGATWKYLDTGVSAGTSWRQATFNDASWSTGQGQFGYGDGDETTLLAEVGTNGQRTVTYYFRHQFEVSQLDAVDNVLLRMLRDDGVAAYLNGKEIARDHLASGAGYRTYATKVDDEDVFQEFEVDRSLLIEGLNTLAIEVHQESDTSSDVSLAVELLANAVVPTEVTTLIPRGDTWRYLEDGSDQQTAWRSESFSDTSWRTGRAEFGYGEADQRTTLRSTRAGGGRIQTYYFRNAFDVDTLDHLQSLKMHVNYDDGFAAFLNGHPLVSRNLDANAGYKDHASASRTDENVFEVIDLDPTWLVVGRNVLAVEVHQESDTSSDVSFDLDLQAITSPGDQDEYTIEITDDQVGESLYVYLASDHDFKDATLELLAPDGVSRLATAIPWVSNEATSIELAIPAFVPTQAGVYTLRLVADVNSEYALVVTQNASHDFFGREPDAATLVSLEPALGFLEETDPSDRWALPTLDQGTWTLQRSYPFTQGGVTQNDLQVELHWLAGDGRLLSVSTEEMVTVPAGATHLLVNRVAGRGEYRLELAPTTVALPGDFNADGIVDADDIDLLCQAMGGSDLRFDLDDNLAIETSDLDAMLHDVLHTERGDANLDGRFDSADFVVVFSRGEYEDDISGNSGWREGDWNCDGEFTTSDLVEAFATGAYRTEAVRAASSASTSMSQIAAALPIVNKTT